MCDCMLYDVLEEKISVNSLLKWLANPNSEVTEIEENRCYQGDFISFFLNYIHDVPAGVDRIGDNPQKASTPKRVERFKHNYSDSSTSTIKRRPALFENLDASHQTDSDTSMNMSFNNNHSTPKTTKNNVNNESYASPLSPLYNRQNFTTPKDKRQPSPRTTPSLCLGDFITHKKSSSKKKVQRNLSENVFNSEENSVSNLRNRRINPTNLMQRKFNNSNFRKTDNSFTFKNEGGEISDNSDGHRSFLVEERMRIATRRNSIDSPVVAVPQTLLITRRKEVVPVFKLITFKEQLNALVVIYNYMLDNNFVLNLTSELYFIISLLLGKEYEDGDTVSPNTSLTLGVTPLDTKFSYVLKSIHNRIYFASKVLQSQLDLLKVLDRFTLRLLIENRRLKQFSPGSFLSVLLKIQEDKTEKLVEIAKHTTQSNVCFISDTDNRDNFPHDASFHAFRKQRDLFYEILRVWENNHLQDEWNFVVALAGKIKALLNMSADTANLVHFARLFKAQLLMNICRKNEEENTVNENQLSFLSSIPNVDAEKLSRLKNRLVGKQTDSGINSIPSFPGYQEFYRDFLSVAANHMFNTHLHDAFISEIVELNNTKFSCSDLDDEADTLIDPATQQSYVTCVGSLSVLAKFLGYLESLPYKSDCPQLPQNVIACQLRIRNKTQPSLNLKDILKAAVQSNSLILTIPWITKYLAMLDYVSLRLSHFEDVFHTLFEIYFHCLTYRVDEYFKFTKLFNHVFLIKLSLGWLFELPHFPEYSYYAWLSKKLSTKPKRPSTENAKLQQKSLKKNMCLDEMDIVDQNVLYMCCPYLQEIKKIMSNDASNSNNTNVAIKHITPLTAAQSPTDLTNKRLQLHLEEAFFNGQPVSIRKTVEFISERIASTCVKQICNEIVPVFKKKALLKFKEIIKSVNEAHQNLDDDFATLKVLINVEANKFATLSLKQLKEQIDVELKTIESTRITSSVESLLASDVLKQTKDVCVTIATRTCHERVQQWINSHVILGVFTKDFDVETKQFLANLKGKQMKVKPMFALPGFGKSMTHNELVPSGFETVENIRKYSWDILEKPNTITTDMIVSLLNSVQQTRTQRCDLNECILTLIDKMLVDLTILLVAHRPNAIEEDTIKQMCAMWKESGCNDLFKTFVCPRNIMILSQSVQIEDAKTSLYYLIDILVTENLLTYEMLELQIDALTVEAMGTSVRLSLDWKKVISGYRKTDYCQK